MPVDSQSADYKRLAPRWEECRDTVAGEAEIHAKRDRYLPRLLDEPDEAYASRLARAPFIGMVGRVLDGLAGLLTRKDPAVVVPPQGEALLPDITGAGETLGQLVARVCREVLTVGRVGLLVDFPPATGDAEAVSVAQAVAAGLRPVIRTYPVESVINRRGASLVVLREMVEQAGRDEFETDMVTQYRVLDLGEDGRGYRQRVFDAKGTQIGQDVIPQMDGRPLPYIPFIIVGDGQQPPLMDLVHLNLHHYRVGADYEHGCHLSGLPTLFLSGYTRDPGDPPIYIGGASANVLPSPEAKAWYVEVMSGFQALRQNLDAKERQMAVLGARLLEAQKKAAETAEAASIHHKGEEAVLAELAQVIDTGIQQALRVLVEWAGGNPDEVEFTLNRDYETNRLSPQELRELVASWMAGAISGQTLFANLQGGEIIGDDVTYEEEQAAIEATGPSLRGVTSRAGQPSGGASPAGGA